LKYIIFFLLILILNFACEQTKQTSLTSDHVLHSDTKSDNNSIPEGAPMFDSTVTDFIKAASLAAQEPQPIDFTTCETVYSVEGLTFDMAAIGKYHNEVQNYVEYCLYVLTNGDQRSYIIFNNDIESHYSPYFKLLKVKGNDTLSITTLAQIYGNEQSDYILSAQGIDETSFELTKLSTFHYLQGSGKVDSTSTETVKVTVW